MVFRLIRSTCGWLVVLGELGWCGLAAYYWNFGSMMKGLVLAGLLLCFCITVMLRTWRHRMGLVTAVFALVLSFWLNLAPSNDRPWQADVSVLPTAEVQGDAVHIRNIRNCDYRSETDYAVRHYDKQVRLSDLRGVDLFLIHWGSPSIAHTMLSFDFGDNAPVCFSVEARKTVGEEYSAVAGFFRQYELIYVVGDERDLVRLRTNFRHEDVWLYRLTFNPDVARSVFLGYLQRINELAARPEWYNAFLNNCTTNIRTLARPYTEDARWDWRMIVNGYADEMAYERGMLNMTLPLDELRRRGYINTLAQQIGDSPDFSRFIRTEVPSALHNS